MQHNATRCTYLAMYVRCIIDPLQIIHVSIAHMLAPMGSSIELNVVKGLTMYFICETIV